MAALLRHFPLSASLRKSPAGSLAAGLMLLALIACVTSKPMFSFGPPPGTQILGDDDSIQYRFRSGERFAVLTSDNDSTGYDPLFTVYPFDEKIDLSPQNARSLLAHQSNQVVRHLETISGPSPNPLAVGAGRDLWYLFEAGIPGRVNLLSFFRKWDGNFSVDGGSLYDIQVLQ
jgi:hypothetical protein